MRARPSSLSSTCNQRPEQRWCSNSEALGPLGRRGGHALDDGESRAAAPDIERAAAPIVEPARANVADAMTFSREARERAAAVAHPRFGAFSVASHDDLGFADEMAYNYGHIDVHQMVDASRDGARASKLRGFARLHASGDLCGSERLCRELARTNLRRVV